jgi:hypothetical protein
MSSSVSISSSFSNVSITSSTSSTSSYLRYDGFPNGTSSHALTASFTINSITSSYILYSGIYNGSASYALTSSYSDAFSIGYSWMDEKRYGLLSLQGAVNDYASLFVSGTVDAGKFYLRTGDNGIEPFIFQTVNSDGGQLPVNRINIDYDNNQFGTTRMTVHGHLSSSTYTSSKVDSVGFLGTSSYSITASYAHTAKTASYITESVLNTALAASSGIIKAWASCVCTSSMPGNSIIGTAGLNANNMALFSSNNITSVVRTMGSRPTDPNNGKYYQGYNANSHWLVTMTNPLPSTNYMVMGTGGETTYEGAVMTMLPLAPRTTTQFTLSMVYYDHSPSFDGSPYITWFNFMVLGT